MGSYYNAPTMVLTPNQEHQAYPFGNQFLDHRLDPSLLNDDCPLAPSQVQEPQNTTMTDLSSASSTISSSTTANTFQPVNRKTIRPRFPRPPSMNYLANIESRPISGRKRSLADTHDGELEADADGSFVSPTNAPSPPKPRGEPVYGPGMTLIYPDDPGFSIAAESQTGTWAEEKNEETETQAANRPVVTSRKSQRRGVPDSISIEPAVSFNTNGAGINGNSPSPTSADPPIDRLTLTLGIGWKRIPAAQAPAAKGWEKFIVNHYDNISDPSILLHSEAHHLYLVRSLSTASDTQECWWVFQEDLSACRLVGFCEEDAIRNLQKGETMGPLIPAATQPRRLSQGETHMQNVATTTWTSTAPETNSNADVEMEM